MARKKKVKENPDELTFKEDIPEIPESCTVITEPESWNASSTIVTGLGYQHPLYNVEDTKLSVPMGTDANLLSNGTPPGGGVAPANTNTDCYIVASLNYNDVGLANNALANIAGINGVAKILQVVYYAPTNVVVTSASFYVNVTPDDIIANIVPITGVASCELSVNSHLLVAF